MIWTEPAWLMTLRRKIAQIEANHKNPIIMENPIEEQKIKLLKNINQVADHEQSWRAIEQFFRMEEERRRIAQQLITIRSGPAKDELLNMFVQYSQQIKKTLAL